MLEGKKRPAANIQRSTQAFGSGLELAQLGNSQFAINAAQKITSNSKKISCSADDFAFPIVYTPLTRFQLGQNPFKAKRRQFFSHG